MFIWIEGAHIDYKAEHVKQISFYKDHSNPNRMNIHHLMVTFQISKNIFFMFIWIEGAHIDYKVEHVKQISLLILFLIVLILLLPNT